MKVTSIELFYYFQNINDIYSIYFWKKKPNVGHFFIFEYITSERVCYQLHIVPFENFFLSINPYEINKVQRVILFVSTECTEYYTASFD